MSAELKDGIWNLDESHFSWAHSRLQPHIGYKMWFFNLRLSKSYFLAHKEALGRLRFEERESLPADFDRVRRTYEAFGSVWEGLHCDWWAENGERLFSLRGPSVRADVVHQSPLGHELDTGLVRLKLDEYKQDVLSQLRDPETLIVSIPLTGHKTEIHKALGALLDQYQDAPRPGSMYRLNNKLIRGESFKKYLDLMWLRMKMPHLYSWEICTELKLTAEAKILNLQKKDPSQSEKDKMMKETSKMLRKARLISESAARGSFPSPLKLELPDYEDETTYELVARIDECSNREEARLNELARR